MVGDNIRVASHWWATSASGMLKMSAQVKPKDYDALVLPGGLMNPGKRGHATAKIDDGYRRCG